MNSRASKNEQAILKRLASVGQNTLAARLSIDESTISKWKETGRFLQIAQLLSELGLKAVPQEFKCIDPVELDHVMYWARRGMQSIKSADDLCFDDDPAFPVEAKL